jgi:AAA+ ATPase superfamily predicted ATPase
MMRSIVYILTGIIRIGMQPPATNPFRFGALALDEAFADRDSEIAELADDIRNGQDVVVFAPRRFGKSSLLWAAARSLSAESALVAEVDLMTTPTKERLAAALAASIFEQIASPLERIREKALAPFRGLSVAPTINVDPEDGSLSFSFGVTPRRPDIDATLERLLELPAELGGARGRRTALVIDEFQEIVELDPDLPKLLRAVFQRQPEVAHVYLGSKRHVMERIFSDAHEPFWRSAKPVELGPIEAAPFAAFIKGRFRESGKEAATDALDELLALTGGHPYATQELCYFLWQQTPAGETATLERLARSLEAVLRSENAHFSLLWEDASRVQKLVLEALAQEEGRPFTAAYRERHELPASTNVQKALRALEQREVVTGSGGEYRIAEPFLAAWLNRQRAENTREARSTR